MIIINQNKDTIINFDKVESIDIVADLDGTGEVPYKICYETSSNREELGKYKTEKRAIEVLVEIATAYTNMKIINIPKIDIHEKITSQQMAKNICYEMPEE